jgi:acylglycerol lipase
VNDVKQVFELMAPKTVPRFIVGHSLGGAISLCVAMKCEHPPTGVVLSGPAILPDSELATPLLVGISG